MTIHRLAFFFEDSDKDIYSGRLIDLDAYRYACKAFGVNHMAVINLSTEEISMNDDGILLEQYSSFEEFKNSHKDSKMLLTEVPWACPAGAYILNKELPEFDWIVIGPSTGWIPHPQDVEWLLVPQNGKGALHSQHIATLILGYIFLGGK